MNTNRTQSEREWRDQAKARQKLLEALAWRPADRAGLQRWQRRQQRRRMLKNLAALALGWASMSAIALAVYLTVRG